MHTKENSIIFEENPPPLGCLFITKDGKLKFEGDIDAYAQGIFDNHLKPMCDEYIKQKLAEEI